MDKECHKITTRPWNVFSYVLIKGIYLHELTLVLFMHLLNNYSLVWTGSMYKDGQGVPQDYQKAMKYFLESAEYAYAQVNIGIIFFFIKKIIMKN